jgi:hypothetical protein
MSDLDTTIEYYKDLILYQYINKPKATETIKLLVKQALVDLLSIAVNDAFDIDTAIGDQLDVIGEYIGFDRVIQSAILRDYFTFQEQESPTDSPVGFTDYNDSSLNISVSFYNYINAQGTTSYLIDDEYRLLLKLKSYTNISQNSLSEIASILYTYFDTDLILFDQFDMSISYFASDSISRIIGIAYQENLLPKPMGVEVTGVFVVDDPAKVWSLKSETRNNTPIGGFTDYNNYYYNLFDYINLSDIVASIINVANTYAGFVITTPTNGSYIPSCEFYLKQGTSVTAKVYAALWDVDANDEPVNNLTIDSTGVDVATGVPVSAGWVKFTFDDQVNLLPSTRYAVVLYTNTADNIYIHNQSVGLDFHFLYNPNGAGWTISDVGATIARANIMITDILDDEIFLNYEDKV